MHLRDYLFDAMAFVCFIDGQSWEWTWVDIEGCGWQLTSEAVVDGWRPRCQLGPHVTLDPVTGAEEEGGAKGEKDGAATA